jgi:peroxiredoxin Q/BCP
MERTKNKKKIQSPQARKPVKKAPTAAKPQVQLSDFLGQFVVLYFYPKDMTPGCTKESCDFAESYGAFKKLGAVVLGVSKDSIASHEKFREKYKLPFELISDEDGKLCQKFGVWKQKSLYGRKYMGIERSTFIIGPDGKILKTYQPVKVTGHVSQVLADLKSLS